MNLQGLLGGLLPPWMISPEFSNGALSALQGQDLTTAEGRSAPPPAGVGQIPAVQPAAFPPSLIQSESGGNWNALNSEGYGGRLQFGQERLADAARAGVIPQGMTGAAFSQLPPEQQMVVENWHFSDIDAQAANMGLDRFIGQTVAGIPITQDAIRSMAHLGGIGGAARFLESGGRYNPSDSNGTSLADYARAHGSGGGMTAPTGGGMPQQSGLLSMSTMGASQPEREPSIWDGLAGKPIVGGLADPDRRARLAIALQGMTMNPNAGLVNMLQSDMDGRREEERVNQTVQWLQSIGRTDLAEAVAAGSLMGGDAAAIALQPAPEREPINVGGVLVDPETYQPLFDSRTGGAEGAASYGLTPQYGVDAEGNPVIMQLSDAGTAVQTQLPDGVALSRDPIRIDTGTEFILLDPITRQPIGTIPKNNREAASETAIGTAEGQNAAAAVAGAPQAIVQADTTIALIDRILADPALPSITGMVQGNLPPLSQGGTDLNVQIEQLKGRTFLEAFESLKGAGQITEREGAAAQAAIARLDRAQSTEAYTQALTELRGIVQTARDRAASGAQAVTGQPAAAVPAMPAPVPNATAGAWSGPSAPEILMLSEQDLIALGGMMTDQTPPEITAAIMARAQQLRGEQNGNP